MKPRLLIIGDSITLGATEVFGEDIISTAPRTYVHDLQTDLGHWEISTDAALHRTTSDAVRMLPGILEAHRPDILLVMLGGGDADINWKRFIVSGGARAKSNVPLATYISNLTSIIATCRRESVVPVLTDVSSSDLVGRTAWLSRRYGSRVDDAVDANGGGQTEVSQRSREYNGAAVALAESSGVPIARWADAVAALPVQERFGPDFVHPGSAAHPIIAQVLSRTLRSTLAQTRNSSAVGA